MIHNHNLSLRVSEDFKIDRILVNVLVRGRFDSVLWKNLFGICEGVDLGIKNWFIYNLGCCVGDESSMLFWWDPCLNERVLKDRLSRFFDLAKNKMVLVIETI